MFCINCGKKLDEVSRFCSSCGAIRSDQNTNVSTAPQTNQVNSAKIENTSGSNIKQATPNMAKNKFPIWAILILAIPIICIPTAIILSAISKKIDSSKPENAQQELTTTQSTKSDVLSEAAKNNDADLQNPVLPTQVVISQPSGSELADEIKKDGWDVQYQDASCIVRSNVFIGEGKPPLTIKMGYLAGDKQIFIFSIDKPNVDEVIIPKGTNAWFVVDNMEFEVLDFSNHDGEFIALVKNGMLLQNTLSSAKKIGLKVQPPHKKKPQDSAWIQLENIPGAMRWLESCSLTGIEALPR